METVNLISSASAGAIAVGCLLCAPVFRQTKKGVLNLNLLLSNCVEEVYLYYRRTFAQLEEDGADELLFGNVALPVCALLMLAEVLAGLEPGNLDPQTGLKRARTDEWRLPLWLSGFVGVQLLVWHSWRHEVAFHLLLAVCLLVGGALMQLETMLRQTRQRDTVDYLNTSVPLTKAESHRQITSLILTADEDLFLNRVKLFDCLGNGYLTYSFCLLCTIAPLVRSVLSLHAIVLLVKPFVILGILARPCYFAGSVQTVKTMGWLSETFHTYNKVYFQK